MIEIINGEKHFKNDVVYKKINLFLDSPGLYGIVGKSGCGKTSLLNIIGLIDDEYEGKYIFDGTDVKEMNDKTKAFYRFNYFSYVFQNPKLIENESIKTNIDLAINKDMNEELIIQTLDRVNLKLDVDKKINTLSGGEKQRLNLAIALLRNTPIILCDEITSGLDEFNKRNVFSILVEEAKNKIIIIVTHDVELLKEFTNKIYYINQKNILINEKKNDSIHINTVNCKMKYKYLIKHVLNIIRERKFRTFICSFCSIIALMCLGICLILTSTVSSSIMNSLGNLVDESKIIMIKKEDSFLIDEHIILPLEKINEIKNKYHMDIERQGVEYLANWNDFFPDENYFSLNLKSGFYNLQGYTVDKINEVLPLNLNNKNYFLKKNKLQEDEVVISLTKANIYSICKKLNVDYVDEGSLFNAMDEYIPMSIFLSNESWTYNLEIDLKLVGYVVDNNKQLFHSNDSWNEYIYEEVMQLPTSNDLNEIDYYPWTIKRIDYLIIKENRIDNFIEKVLADKELNDYSIYNFYKNGLYCVSFEYRHDNKTRFSNLNRILNENNQDLLSYITCSSNNYNVNSTVLMEGFNYPTYLVTNYDTLEEYCEYNSYSEDNYGVFQSTILSYSNDDMISLNILDSSKNNFSYVKTYCDEKTTIIGKYPSFSNEIIVSKGLLNKLRLSIDNYQNNELFLLSLIDIAYENGKYHNVFKNQKIKIVGIYDDEDSFIYVNNYWNVSFWMRYFGVSQNILSIDSTIFYYSGNDVEKEVSKLNEKYDEYEFTNPYIDYKKKIDSTIKYLTIGLSIFSSFCLISSLIMLMFSSYLFVSDTRKEIAIYTYYGYKKNDIKKQYMMFSFFIGIYSNLISLIGLTLMILIINNMNTYLYISFGKNLFLIYILVVIISLVISMISSFTSTFKTFHKKLLVQIQEN